MAETENLVLILENILPKYYNHNSISLDKSNTKTSAHCFFFVYRVCIFAYFDLPSKVKI